MDENFEKKKSNLFLTIIIFVVFFILVLVNYQQFLQKKQISLAFDKIKNTVEKSQNMALWGEHFNGQVPTGYGVYIDFEQKSLVIFADLNDNKLFDEEQNELVEKIYLQEEVQLQASTMFVTIFFEKYKKIDGVCINAQCQNLTKEKIFKIVSQENEYFSKDIFFDPQTKKLVYE